MDIRRCHALLFAAVLALFGQRADALYTQPAFDHAADAVAAVPHQAEQTYHLVELYLLGQADDGEHIELAVLVDPETHTRVVCIVKSPLGLYSWSEFRTDAANFGRNVGEQSKIVGMDVSGFVHGSFLGVGKVAKGLVYDLPSGIGALAGNLSVDPAGTAVAVGRGLQALPGQIPGMLADVASDPVKIGEVTGDILVGVLSAGASKAGVFSKFGKLDDVARVVDDVPSVDKVARVADDIPSANKVARVADDLAPSRVAQTGAGGFSGSADEAYALIRVTTDDVAEIAANT